MADASNPSRGAGSPARGGLSTGAIVIAVLLAFAGAHPPVFLDGRRAFSPAGRLPSRILTFPPPFPPRRRRLLHVQGRHAGRPVHRPHRRSAQPRRKGAHLLLPVLTVPRRVPTGELAHPPALPRGGSRRLQLSPRGVQSRPRQARQPRHLRLPRPHSLRRDHLRRARRPHSGVGRERDAEQDGIQRGAWFLGNTVSQNLLNTGAFEVFYDGEVIFSKLEQRRLPTIPEILDGLGDAIAAREGAGRSAEPTRTKRSRRGGARGEARGSRRGPRRRRRRVPGGEGDETGVRK